MNLTNNQSLTKEAVQHYVDGVLGEAPFTSFNQCADIDCLTEKLATHRERRTQNLYISLFVHRFVEFVGRQMHDKNQVNPKSQPMMVVTTQYVLLYPLLNIWHFSGYSMQTDPTNNPNAIQVGHVEIIPPNKQTTNYGNLLIVSQLDNIVIIPFDGEVVSVLNDIPWHNVMGHPDRPFKNVHVLSTNNPMLSMMWLHATMHMAGDVIKTLQGPLEDLNGMAMYELQMADLLIPKGNIQDILTQYETERVNKIKLSSVSNRHTGTVTPPVTDGKQL
jgi:hypothetical protein